jgi:large conductance mechanosensitive channel
MAGGFKQFLLRGNVVDLAVGVVVGAAFGGVVTAFTKDLLTPLIAAVAGKPDFSAIQFTVNNSKFLIGDLINAVVSFLIIATAVYYMVVLPVNALVSRARREPPADPTTKKCPECLSEVAIGAKRCAFCTSQLAAQGAASSGISL